MTTIQEIKDRYKRGENPQVSQTWNRKTIGVLLAEIERLENIKPVQHFYYVTVGPDEVEKMHRRIHGGTVNSDEMVFYDQVICKPGELLP